MCALTNRGDDYNWQRQMSQIGIAKIKHRRCRVIARSANVSVTLVASLRNVKDSKKHKPK